MDLSDPKIQTALIAAGVTLFTLLLRALSKPIWERSFHKFKLESDYKYSQQKAVREAVAEYKTQLLNTGESLNHRLWNFSENCEKQWHLIGENEKPSDKYYLSSFCYRYLLFFSVCYRMERELVHLDSTVSTEVDLRLVKYLKLMPQFFCDVKIFTGTGYNPEFPVDHFFSDSFKENLLDLWVDNGDFLSFQEFRERLKDGKFSNVAEYFSGISAQRNCLRWQALSGFHFVLMSFLNEYGYDFQKTSKSKLIALGSELPKNALASNVEEMVSRINLSGKKQITLALSALKT